MINIRDKNLYYVGGVVRDEILNLPSFDIDLCYEGNAVEFAQKSDFNIIKTNPDFGTVRIKLNNQEIDIASTREEDYPQKGHLPVVKNIGCSLKDDLKRRDFTINAIAKNTLTGEITDYYNGIEDIKNKKLRVLHDKSFIDDPTRIIRGLKFSVRFGFELDSDTYKLQNEYLKNINYDMSYHRVKKEIMETFNLNSASAFDRFIEQGIYKLLGNNQKSVKIKGTAIKKEIDEYNHKENIWLIYMSFFNLSKLALTRKEKKILECAKKLDSQNPTNNTPKESLIIHSILNKESS